MESVRLKQVTQAVGALERVVLRAFGPHGGQVLFTRDTGQATLSRHGAHILTLLRLDNPFARMIVDCASVHSARTGDGSKTFVLLLASLVRAIDAAASRDPPPSLSSGSRDTARLISARRLAEELLSFSLHRLDDLLAVGVLPFARRLTWSDLESSSSSSSPVRELLSSFFRTRLGHGSCGFVSGLLCELLSSWTSQDDAPLAALQFLDDMWPALHTPVTGLPLSHSGLIQGQVIHRDFSTPFHQTPQAPIKAVVINGPLHPKVTAAGEVLEMKDDVSVLCFSSFAEGSLRSAIARLKSSDVSVLLSSVKQSAAALALAVQAQIHILECIDQEELALFQHLTGARPVGDCRSLQAEHVVSLEFCKPILLGAHRCVHVGFHENQTFKPRSVLLCGAADGQAEQCAAAVQGSLRMLLTTWQPPPPAPCQSPSSPGPSCDQRGCVTGAGGTFEFLLSRALQQRPCSSDEKPVSQILASSLLCVPRHIYSHDPRRFARVQSEVFKRVSEPTTALSQKHASPEHSAPFQSEYCSAHSGLESVFSKSQLLLATVQCLSRLFRIDTVIHTRGRAKTISRTNISWKDSEDEHES